MRSIFFCLSLLGIFASIQAVEPAKAPPTAPSKVTIFEPGDYQIALTISPTVDYPGGLQGTGTATVESWSSGQGATLLAFANLHSDEEDSPLEMAVTLNYWRDAQGELIFQKMNTWGGHSEGRITQTASGWEIIGTKASSLLGQNILFKETIVSSPNGYTNDGFYQNPSTHQWVKYVSVTLTHTPKPPLPTPKPQS